MDGIRYDPRFVHFLVLFNDDQDYFECHEIMEELWLEEGRSLLLQGLLQAAVGLYHWRNGNIGGGVKLFAAALEKLAGCGDSPLGIGLNRLRTDTDLALKALRAWQAKTAGPEPGAAPGTEGEAAAGDRGPAPAFAPFFIEIVDPALSGLAAELAAVPPEHRLRTDEEEER